MSAPKVLVVEDSDDLRYLYEEALRNEGVAAVTAENGHIALELLRAADPKPCLVVLDLMMPVMDGWEFLRRRADDPTLAGVPVVVCSAAKTDIPSGIEFLKKPVDLKVLMATIERHCAG